MRLQQEIILRQLHPKDEAVFYSSLELWKDEDISWYSFILEKNPGIQFSKMLEILSNEHQGIALESHRVPATMLYAFTNENKIIGRFNIRHRLNDYLLKRGGNIGYAVAASYRNRGVATEMMRLGLIYCKEQLNLTNLLITCTESNEGSIKLIEKFGGVLENKAWDDEHNENIRRYWLKI